jgi:chitodextrinase
MTVSGVKNYDVLVDGVVRATVTGTSATISGLSPSTEYDVTVRARDNANNVSAQSSVLAVTTSAPSGDVTAPTVPTGLGSSAVATTTATVSWNPSTDAVGVTTYQVYVNGSSVGTTGSTSFGLTGLTAGTAHSVTVRAGDAAGNWSAQSSALTVTTEAGGVVPDLVAHWKFAEASGVTATDEVSGKVLTFANTPNRTTDGDGRPAVVVTLAHQGGLCTNMTGLQTSSRTFTFWARRDSSADEWLRGVAFRQGTSSPMLIAVHAAAPYTGFMYARARTSGADHNIYSVAAEPTGEWHHYALSHDGTTARLYLDGAQVATVAAAGSIDNAGEFRVAQNGGMAVSDVRVYSRALTVDDLALIMAE